LPKEKSAGQDHGIQQLHSALVAADFFGMGGMLFAMAPGLRGPGDAAKEEYPYDGYDEDGAAIPGVVHAGFLSRMIRDLV
jgi:hypothetical protein